MALRVTNWVPRLLLLVLLLMLVIWSARWGWAEVLAAEPRNIMNHWKAGQIVPSAEEMDRLEKLLIRAEFLNSNNADILFDQGRFAELKAQQYSLWSKEAHKHRGDAVKYFKRALDIRPTWGMAWAHLANSLTLNQQLYSGGMEALEKATILAALDTPVQQRVIWLALSQWGLMDEEMRGRVQNIIRNSLVYHDRNLVIQTIVIYKLEDELAELFDNEYYWKLLQEEVKARKMREQN